MNLVKERKIEENIIGLSVILASFVGAQFYSISLNKIALLPLEMYLLIKSSGRARVNGLQKTLAFWYGFAICSALVGLILTQEFLGAESKLIFWGIQAGVIYLPIVLLSGILDDPFPIVKKALILMAKINAIWALVQFLCWSVNQFDINDYIFNEIFKGVFGGEWSVWNYEAGFLALRVSGFQSDAAFFAILIIFGFVFTESIIWKVIFYGICFLSMSRTGIVVITVVTFIDIFKLIVSNRVKTKVAFIGIVVLFGAVFGFIYAYQNIPGVAFQVEYMLFRMQNIGGNTDAGTSRHLLYIPVAFRVWAEEYGIVTKLFGLGPRVGGIGLSISNVAKSNMMVAQSIAWAIECDFAEILLGQGLLGILIYYILYKLYKNWSAIRKCIFAIVLAGVMYNVLETTLIQLIIILFVASYKEELNKR